MQPYLATLGCPRSPHRTYGMYGTSERGFDPKVAIWGVTFSTFRMLHSSVTRFGNNYQQPRIITLLRPFCLCPMLCSMLGLTTLLSKFSRAAVLGWHRRVLGFHVTFRTFSSKNFFYVVTWKHRTRFQWGVSKNCTTPAKGICVDYPPRKFEKGGVAQQDQTFRLAFMQQRTCLHAPLLHFPIGRS